MYNDPYNRDKPERVDNGSSSRAEELMVYLATRKEPQTKHVATVSALLQFKASAFDTIQKLNMELDRYRMRDMDGYIEGPKEHRQPQTLQIPINARSVEVKF